MNLAIPVIFLFQTDLLQPVPEGIIIKGAIALAMVSYLGAVYYVFRNRKPVDFRPIEGQDYIYIIDINDSTNCVGVSLLFNDFHKGIVQVIDYNGTYFIVINLNLTNNVMQSFINNGFIDLPIPIFKWIYISNLFRITSLGLPILWRYEFTRVILHVYKDYVYFIK